MGRRRTVFYCAPRKHLNETFAPHSYDRNGQVFVICGRAVNVHEKRCEAHPDTETKAKNPMKQSKQAS